jgi:parvulin-like peptidyl-prolyl isomerase
LQQSFVAQLVQQAEFDVAGKQLKVAIKQKDVDASLQKLELQYAKGANGKVDPTKWKKVLTDNHTTESNVLDNIKDGLLRQAIYVKLTKDVTVSDSAIASYYAKNKKTYATPASRAIRHILVKVSKPVKSSYGWHVIEATADTVPASQRPLDKALKTQIRGSLLTTKKQSVANKWFKTFQKKIEKTVRYATGFAPAKTTSTAASTAATAQTTTG